MSDQVNGILSPWLRKQRLKVSLPYVTGKVLDFGCGVGKLADYVNHHDYVGVDSDEGSLHIAKENYHQHRFLHQIPDEKFDSIVMLAVIEHIKDPAEWLIKMSGYLSNSGQIIMTTPHPSAEKIHTWGSRIGLFSADAHEEHESLLNKAFFLSLGTVLPLKLYKRFQFGMNQLVILNKI